MVVGIFVHFDDYGRWLKDPPEINGYIGTPKNEEPTYVNDAKPGDTSPEVASHRSDDKRFL